jgi:hypothetical protein
MFVAINYSPRTTAWMQEVEQRKEQLPRHEEHEVLAVIFSSCPSCLRGENSLMIF